MLVVTEYGFAVVAAAPVVGAVEAMAWCTIVGGANLVALLMVLCVKPALQIPPHPTLYFNTTLPTRLAPMETA